jgi:hypothetical protein
MSIRVFAWDANPNVDRHLYPQSNRRAAEIVGSGRGEYIQLADGRTAVQLKASPVERAEKSIGSNNLVPFGRAYNPMMQPPSLHYEIPRAGDCRSICTRRFNLRSAKIIGAGTRHVLLSRTRKVSARKIDFTRPLSATPARVLSNSNLTTTSSLEVSA